MQVNRDACIPTVKDRSQLQLAMLHQVPPTQILPLASPTASIAFPTLNPASSLLPITGKLALARSHI